MSRAMARRGARAAAGPAGVWLVVLAVAVPAVLIWLGPAGQFASSAGRIRVGLVLLGAFTALAELVRVNFEYRHEPTTLSFSEVLLVVGLALATPRTLLAGGLAGLVLAKGVVQRQPPPKLFFNVAVRALELGVATVVFRGLLGSSPVVSPVAWAAMLAAVLSADAVSFVCVIGVIRVASGAIDPRAVGTFGTLNLAVAVANTALGLVTVLLVSVDAWAVVLLGAIAVILALVYRQYSIVQQRYANLRLLYGFSGGLAGARPGDDALRHVLEQSAALVQADRAELTLPAGSTWMRVLLDEHGSLRREYLVHPDPIATAVLEARDGIVVASGAVHALRPVLDQRGERDLVASALLVDDERAGALVALNRDSDVRTFDAEDLALFQALANHASVALRNARLVDRLTEEAAHRAHQAMHDALTGLGNRELFAERVNNALHDRSGGSGSVAVMLMDLDEFKEINDTLGHHTGDTVLREMATRLSRTVGTRGAVARLGGDEFAVSLPSCASADEALRIAQDIRRTIEQPLLVDELVLELHVSIGVAISPEHGQDPSALLQRADVAMYSAKSARRGVELYAADRDHYSQRRLALAGELRQAIGAGGLGLVFQPKVALVDGRVTGLEALVRWHHPRHGFVPPDEFIPVAEQSGLIQPLTRWVLGQALQQVAQWQRAGLELSVAVNLSARSLLDAGLVEDIARALTYADVPAASLVLELTESTVMADPDRSQIVLQQLADLGCRLSIDDFGTGYSSLSRLKQLPVDEIKIDKSFVLHMATDSEDAAIVRSIIDLARNLALHVVAEGVEDADTLERLRLLGCDIVQGYFLCRPNPAPEIDTWLESHPVGRRPMLCDGHAGPQREAWSEGQPTLA